MKKLNIVFMTEKEVMEYLIKVNENKDNFNSTTINIDQ